MRATLEESFYNVTVTTAEMWQKVGRVLERARLDRKWRPIQVERAGGPSYKTVQAIEAGKAGRIDSLDKCARALGLELVDIVQSVLASTVTPLSPEAALVVRSFEGTTVAGRQAYLMMARALDREAGDAGAPPTPRPLRPVPPATKRRNG